MYSIKNQESFFWPQKLRKYTEREKFAMYLPKNEYRQIKLNLSKLSHNKITDCHIDTAKIFTPLDPNQMRFHII